MSGCGAANIVSVGIDYIRVSEVREALTAFGDRYLNRIFTPGEVADCLSSTDPVPRLAARFAAKEATIKALMVEGPQPVWTSMEVVRHVAGWCDEVRLSGSAAELADRRGIGRVVVSLSHEDDAAVAVVAATKASKPPLEPAVTSVNLAGTARPSARQLHVAFVNNMPDAAFEETYRQFASLLQVSPLPMRIRCYVLSSVPRKAETLVASDVRYLDHREIYRDRPDAIVITGTEPKQPELASEPYWEDLAELLSWAESNVSAVLLSCLASHAAGLAIDGIRRRRLPSKCSGVFAQKVAQTQTLASGLGERVAFPHSRLNGIDSSDLIGHGYDIVLASEDDESEWTMATRDRDGRLFALLQGHPEYARTTLLREFRRDLRRYVGGEAPTCPQIPENYLDEIGTGVVSEFRDECLAGRHGSVDSFPYQEAARHVRAQWDGPSRQLIGNWIVEARSRAGLAVPKTAGGVG